MKLTANDVATAVPALAEGVEQRSGPAGELRLRGPRHRRGPLGRVCARVFRLADRVEVELDDIGCYVIEHMDGRSLAQLAGDLASKLQLRQREAEGALVTFMQGLLRRKLVRLRISGEAG